MSVGIRSMLLRHVLSFGIGSRGALMICLLFVGCLGSDDTSHPSTVPSPSTNGSPSADAPNASAASVNSPKPWFTDVTESSQIDFEHDRGPVRYWLPEITGGGAAWIDYDSDGDQDLYLVQSGQNLGQTTENGPGNRLYRNRGDGTFEDVTTQAGVGDTQYGMGATAGDYDQDGDLDLYVTNVGNNVLYRNRGDGTFEDVTEEAGVKLPGWSMASAFVDYDQDGDTDLMVLNYIRWSPDKERDCRTGKNEQDYCSPATYQASQLDTLFRNRGDGTFEDVSREVGLHAADGNGMGLIVCDFNNDGRIDFYVANDGNPNQLWLQDEGGHFRDEALLQGCAVNRFGAAQAGMGVAAIDVENDSDFDLFITHLAKEMNTLYINEGSYFSDQTAEFKLAAPSLNYTGFGLGFVDFDHDTRLDLFVANGRVGKYASPIRSDEIYAEPNLLFRGQPDGTFAEVAPQGGTEPVLVENSRASALADYDRDGDLDMAIVNNGGRLTLLRNELGKSSNWIRFLLIDSRGREAVGAKVGIQINGKWYWRLSGRTHGYLSSNEPEVHFGLGEAKQVDGVKIIWPGHLAQELGSFSGGQIVRIQQH